MAINTFQSLSGFIVTEPVLTPEGDHMRLDATVGQARHIRTPGGGFEQTDPDLCHLIMRGVPAMRAAGQFRVGDSFLAEGRLVSETVYNADTGEREQRPVFTATRIGPDTASTSYEQIFQRRIHPKPSTRQPFWPAQPVGLKAPSTRPSSAPTL